MTSGLKCAAIAVLCVGLAGCRIFGRTKPAPVQAAAPPHPAEEVKPPPPKVEPPGPPPKIDTKTPEVPQAVAVIPTPPAPKPKKQKPKKPPATAVGAAQNPPPAKDPTAATATGENGNPPPVPKLGEILSDDQKLQNLKICDESLIRARENVSQLRGLSLSQDQKQSLARIRTFIDQAQQARQKDPQTARQLAERADLLSRDLVKTLR